jgi:putative ABC transport system permease protein
MLRVALGTVKARTGGILGALVGVTVAISLVVSSGIVLESTLRTEIPVERLSEAVVVVNQGQSFGAAGDATDEALPEQTRIDGGLAERLGALPGVERAVADRSFPTEILASDGRRLAREEGEHPAGHGWSSAALAGLALTEGRAPRAASEIVLDAGLAAAGPVALGERVRIATASGLDPFTVVGVAAPPQGHGPSSTPAAYIRDDGAGRLAGTGDRADLIGITVPPGTDVQALADRVREVTAPLGLRVLTGSQRGEAESIESVLNRGGVLSGLGLLAALGTFVAIFVVSSAFALSVQQRHRELALLRAIGATPRQVRRLIAVEALVIAVVGTILAALLGFLMAMGERRVFVHTGVLPADFRLVVGWIPIAVGLAAAVVTTQLASFVSGRRASRIRPVDALREAAVERRPITPFRAVAGLVALVVGVAVFVTTTRNVSGGGGDDAPAAGLVWMLSATLLGPLLALPFVWAIGRPLAALSPGPGLLARANSRANLRHLVSVATPLMLAVSLACALLIARATVERVTREQVSQSLTADHVLVPASGGLLPQVAAAARSLPEVEHVAATSSTSVIVSSGANKPTLPALAVDGPALAGALDLDVSAGSLASVRGASFAADSRLARQLGWGLGDRVGLWLGDGSPVELRLVALFRRPLGFGQVVLPRGVTAGHVSDPLDTAVFVTAEPGASEAAVAADLQGLADVDAGVQVLTRSQYLDRLDAEARKQSLAAYALLGIIVLFSAIAAVNALAVAVSARARDLELLRLIGATRRQLTRMIRFEVLIVVTFATLVGALTAAPGVIAFTYGQTGSLVPTVPAWLWLGLPLTAAVLASVAIALPLRAALKASRGSVTAGAL